MKFSLVIMAVAAIAIGIIHIRRTELSISHELQSLELQGIKYRRQIWQKQVDLGHVISPPTIKQQVTAMGLELIEGGSTAQNTSPQSLSPSQHARLDTSRR